MSTLKTNAVQIGQSVTATNNFTVYQPTSPDGTVRIGNGNAGSVTDVVSVTSTGVVVTGDVQSTSHNGAQLAGLRNKIINGNMSIFQRGATAVTTNGVASPTTTSNYGPTDRFRTDTVGVGQNVTASQILLANTDTLYATGGAIYAQQYAVTSAANAANYSVVIQAIEDVTLFAGDTITVSFWAKAAAGSPSIAVSVDQFFGTGGSANVNGVGQAVVLSTTWTKYTKTFSVASISGLTVGVGSSTILTLWLDAGTNFNSRAASIGQVSKTVSIAQVQVENGSVATPFEFRHIGMELALCQRYYYRNTPGVAASRFGTGFNTTATIGQVVINFPVTMRTAPASLEQTGTPGDYGVANAGVGTVCTSVPTLSAGVSTSTAMVLFTVTTAMTIGQGSSGYAFTTAAYLGFNAEL